MLRLASDADVHGEIIRGLRRRLPEIDLVRTQDALPEGTPDPEVLAWAAGENRIRPFQGGVQPCATRQPIPEVAPSFAPHEGSLEAVTGPRKMLNTLSKRRARSV
jgi:hypothetical protein